MVQKILDTNKKILGVYGFVIFFLVWQVVPSIGVVDSHSIPAFSTVLEATLKLVSTGELFVHIASSLQRILLGLLCAIVTAVTLGFILGGWFPRLTSFLNPLLTMLGQINAFSLFPIFILFFGVGESAKFSIIYWSSIWPIFFTTVTGVQNVDPILIKGAKSMGASQITIFLNVILPGAASSIFTGIRAGATTAFLMMIPAEMFQSVSGLGWLTHNSNVNNVVPRIFVAAVFIALLSMGLVFLINYIESMVITWKEDVKA